MRAYQNFFLRHFPEPPIFYANASHALYDIMVWLQSNRPKSDPNIVMPVYIPAKMYRFVLAAGYRPKFYDVSTRLDFSLSEIEKRIDRHTQLIMAVHFFGIPVDMEPLRELAEKRGIFLLEDCAHTLGGRINGKLLGTTGHFSIFSTRKMLQVYCGGFLLRNHTNWKYYPSSFKRVSNLFTAYHLIGSRIKFMLNRMAKQKNLFVRDAPYRGYIDFSEKQKVTVKMMDHMSIIHFGMVDLPAVISKRRENIKYLWDNIQRRDLFEPIELQRLADEKHSNGFVEYYPVDGYVPFSFPLLTKPGMRDHIQMRLLEYGVFCYSGWPESPFGMTGFPGAMELQSRLLELPVHHYMNRYQLDRMIAAIKSL